MIAWYDRIGNSIEMKLYEDADSPEFKWVKGNVIEGYRYQDGIISMKSDDGRIIWCGVASKDFRKSEDSLGDFISNADRIRAMSDEELAELITSGELCSICHFCQYYRTKDCYIENEGKHKNCDKGIMKWLQSEVEE